MKVACAWALDSDVIVTRYEPSGTAAEGNCRLDFGGNTGRGR